ncbi:7,8-dihydroneopterin aldolase/epimerase/oxygenase [Sphingomonas sp. F9_3S_D5_B_2]
MTTATTVLKGLVPDHLKVRSSRIMLESLEVTADIGFHEFEIGSPQRLLVTVEIWLEDSKLPADDDPSRAWNYDFVRSQVLELTAARRYNLQETLAHAIFERLAAIRGVRALRLRMAKPDVYPDAAAVGIEIASFPGVWPQS